ncbi:LOW QUALITY PROTEIN: hypothetical protein TorRG33x02_357650 [Trema orientale]|uniref:Uncharacterized protein n=1 Tax=Trema orientale TaxID=63057 RepID=A0A2P5A4R6_TREOI|nr:LOW QUALITY PROTEIN: hypothetical protein TorRG33x02_357650 [Trema orientale]
MSSAATAGLASTSVALSLKLGHPVSVTIAGMFWCPETVIAQMMTSTIMSKRFW